MSDQPQNTRPPTPSWLPTLLLVVGVLLIITFLALTLLMATLDGPPIRWKMMMSGLLCLALGLWLRAKSPPAN